MDIQQGVDLTKNSAATWRVTDEFRVVPAQVIPKGALVQMASLDNQQWLDYRTASLVPAGANAVKLIGLVSEDWSGFDGVGGTSAPGGVLSRGTAVLKATIYGYHPSALFDNTAGVAIVDGTVVQSSATTSGYLQGVAAGVAAAVVGTAALPAAGFGSTLGVGALVAATQTLTIGGVPAAGDVYSVVIQVPWANTTAAIPAANISVLQTRTITSPPLTAAQAASVTTAAAQEAIVLNADPAFAKYFTATAALGVITVAVKATSWNVTFLSGAQAQISAAGTVGNTITIAASKTGASTFVAGGATFAGGAGFVGTAPVYVGIF